MTNSVLWTSQVHYPESHPFALVKCNAFPKMKGLGTGIVMGIGKQGN